MTAVPPSVGTPLASETLVIAPPPKRTASPALIAVLIVLAVLLAAAAGVGVWLFLQLNDANDTIDQQQDEIGELNDLIDGKEEFGAAMQGLMDTARTLDGAPLADLVPIDDYTELAHLGWVHRRTPTALAADTARAESYRSDLEQLAGAVQAERDANTTGSYAEGVLDAASGGYASLVFDDASAVCQREALGCVTGDQHRTIHLDAAGFAHPSMDDWGARLVTLHEYAHVLQFSNPDATDAAAGAFGDDWEFMADCYALTEMDSWTLDHRVWESSYAYWDVSYGYGRVCDASQRDVIRTWVAETGFHYHPVSQ
ncbi:MAG: hypothetical protein J0G30_09270 [Actinomycetales bacterium]|nr:hypothetical protein [Actinomycetales bacterium]